MVRPVGVAVTPVEELPVLALDLGAAQPLKTNACVMHLAPFLFEVLPLLVGEARQEVVEVDVAIVLPVELHRASKEHAARMHELRFLLLGKEHMKRRHALGHVKRLADEQRAIGIVSCEHSRAGHWGERDRPQQLWVVLQSVARIGVGPRPVEYVFAIGMRL